MSVTKIYLIRHGESEGNSKNLFLGHTDLDITERGHLQAECTAKYLENVHADVIYSSDLIRAYSTALHTARVKNMEVIKTAKLREIYAGLWENLSYAEIQEKYPEDREVWRYNIGVSRPTGGESFIEVRDRINVALKEIAKENEGKSVFCFTHAAVIRSVSAYYMGYSHEEMQKLPWADNASVTELEYENGKFTLVRYGYDEHLRAGGLNYIPQRLDISTQS